MSGLGVNPEGGEGWLECIGSSSSSGRDMEKGARETETETGEEGGDGEEVAVGGFKWRFSGCAELKAVTSE